MTESYKVLGQSLTASGETTIYTVPVSTQTAISAIIITSSDTSAQTYNLSFVPNAETSNILSLNKHIAINQKTINANETHEIAGGITLAAGDQIRIYSTVKTIMVNVYGVEIS